MKHGLMWAAVSQTFPSLSTSMIACSLETFLSVQLRSLTLRPSVVLPFESFMTALVSPTPIKLTTGADVMIDYTVDNIRRVRVVGLRVILDYPADKGN